MDSWHSGTLALSLVHRRSRQKSTCFPYRAKKYFCFRGPDPNFNGLDVQIYVFEYIYQQYYNVHTIYGQRTNKAIELGIEEHCWLRPQKQKCFIRRPPLPSVFFRHPFLFDNLRTLFHLNLLFLLFYERFHSHLNFLILTLTLHSTSLTWSAQGKKI